MDLTGKLFINNIWWASACSLPFLVCCSRFIHEDPVVNYLIKFTDLAIPMLVDLEKDAYEIKEDKGR